MPAKRTMSGLAAKLGDAGRKAWEAHKNDEVNYGQGGDLPGGIDNGIAQLVECKFGVYKTGDNAGEYFFYAAGTVVKPKEHEGLPIEGLRTQIMEPMCETPGRSRETIEDHVAWVVNEMKKLGVATEDVAYDDLESTAAALKESAPYFMFRTWQGEATEQYPNPRVNHTWRKALPDYTPEDDGSAVTDNTAKAPSSPAKAPAAAKAAPKPSSAPKASPAAKPASDKEVSEPGTGIGDELDALADKADEGDADAQAELTRRAVAAGIEEKAVEEAESFNAVAQMMRDAGAGGESATEGGDSIMELGRLAEEDGDQEAADKLMEIGAEHDLDGNAYPTWTEFAEAIVEAQGGASGETSAADADWAPAKGEMYFYTPPKAKKAVECEVMAVFEETRKVNLKNSDDGKTNYKGVSWDDLKGE
jgi:hypothetical protein